MSRNRYQHILRVLRFDDANSRRRNISEDKFQSIRNFFQKWDLNLHDAYIPGPHMTLNKQLVCFRGKCPFQQYIASKPGKYGIKIYAICKANTSYASKMQVYTEKNHAVGREVNQEARVVKDLVKKLNILREIILTIIFVLHSACSRSAEKEVYSGGNYLEEQTRIASAIHSC